MASGPDVFLSYAKSDRDKAKKLADALKNEGWSVWWDVKIPPGKTWADVIETALKACRCVVVLWSTASVDSKWVKKEARNAESRDCLVPVLIESTQLPFEFEHLQAADLTEWLMDATHDSFAELVAEIRSRFSLASANQTESEDVLPVKSKQRAHHTSDDKSLFPVYGIVLGKSTMRDVQKLGFRVSTIDEATGEPHLCVDVEGILVWFDRMSNVVTHLDMGRYAAVPRLWTDLGLDFSKSYKQWLSLLDELGYSVKVETPPHLETFRGRDSLSAEVVGQRQGRYPHRINLLFSRGNKTATEAHTLFAVRVGLL
jgi:hypothetical protein